MNISKKSYLYSKSAPTFLMMISFLLYYYEAFWICLYSLIFIHKFIYTFYTFYERHIRIYHKIVHILGRLSLALSTVIFLNKLASEFFCPSHKDCQWPFSHTCTVYWQMTTKQSLKYYYGKLVVRSSSTKTSSTFITPENKKSSNGRQIIRYWNGFMRKWCE